jgi:hypothetical protein
MSLVLQSSGGGQITIQEPATASNFTQNLPAASGTIALASTIPAFAAHPSAGSTNISSSTWTKVVLDTELYDTNSNFASSTFTPTVAGYYQINFTINTGTSANNGLWHSAAIYKNGSAYIQAFPVFPAGNIQSYANNLSQVIFMNGSTDYLEFYVNVYVLSGTPNYSGGQTNTIASGSLVRAS